VNREGFQGGAESLLRPVFKSIGSPSHAAGDATADVGKMGFHPLQRDAPIEKDESVSGRFP
jgi:hypothetical protein